MTNFRFPSMPPFGDRRLKLALAAAATVAIAAGGALLAAGAANKPDPATAADAAAPKTALTITLAIAATHTFDERVLASGPVAAWQEAAVGAPLAGLRLVALHVDVGAAVRRGEVLAQYDTAGLLAALDLAEANAAQARAVAAQASANNARSASLKDSGAMSEQDLLQLSTQQDIAKAQLASTLATLRATRVQLRDATIRAPDDGVISARSATLGAVGAVGQELFRLIRGGRVEWRAQLTPAQAGMVAAGQAAGVAVAGQAASVGAPGRAVGGRVRLVAPGMDPLTHLLTAYVDVAAGAGLRAGMYASGDIKVGAHRGVGVPAASVVARDGRDYVFVVQRDAHPPAVRRRQVGRGGTEGALIEIVDGLRAGEAVAGAGAGFLEDGDLVRIAPADASKGVSQ